MRNTLIALSLLVTAAAPALAQDAPAPFTITGGATLTSDYRFRGISQTNKRFAIQGTLGVTTAAGFYVGTWGSSVDDYVAGGSDQEIDLYGGYKKTFSGTTVDGGLLYYIYPGNAKGTTTDFFEPYLNVSHTFGPLGVKVGGNFAWKQHGLYNGDPRHSRSSGAYVYGELSGGLPGTGLTLTGHLGHSFARNFIDFNTHYTDWSLTAAYAWKALTFSVAYVDTNHKLFSYPAGGGGNHDVAHAGVVGAVAVAF